MKMRNKLILNVFLFAAAFAVAARAFDSIRIGVWIPPLEKHKNSRIKINQADLLIVMESCEFEMQGACCNKYGNTYLTGYEGRKVETICISENKEKEPKK